MQPREAADRAPNRFDVERAIKKADSLPPIAAHLLLDLCTYMDQGSTTIPYKHGPSLTMLTRDSKWSRRTVIRYLAWLEHAGWLTRLRPTVAAARKEHKRTAYIVHVPEWVIEAIRARDSEFPGLGLPDAQARVPPTLELGQASAQARARARLKPDQPDLSDQGLADIVIAQMQERTGKTVTREWAAQTVQMILARPGIKSPRAYLVRTISTDPNPQRWLPTETPPPF